SIIVRKSQEEVRFLRRLKKLQSKKVVVVDGLDTLERDLYLRELVEQTELTEYERHVINLSYGINSGGLELEIHEIAELLHLQPYEVTAAKYSALSKLAERRELNEKAAEAMGLKPGRFFRP